MNDASRTPRFAGVAALVTGAGGGIGSAVARRLASEGASVAVTDIDGAAAEVTAAGVPRAIARQLDVGDAAQVERTFEDAEAALGPLGVVVHVAGVFVAFPMVETPDTEIARLLLVNVEGAFHVLRAAGRRMAPRGGGAIVTVASQSSVVVRKNQALYGATKAASTYLTKALGLELASAGVRCNVVQPGVTDTPMSRRVWDAGKGSPDAHVRGDLERHRVGIPLGKVATADDIAAAVLFLASSDASHITMQDVVVDGGATLIA